MWLGITTIDSRKDTEVLEYASLYETAPAYYTDQGDFLNSAILVRTKLQPLGLLDALKKIESELGRKLEGAIRFGPRPLDLDIVFYGSGRFSDDRLEIPHPRWVERSFVLAPLSDFNTETRRRRSFGGSECDDDEHSCSKYLDAAKRIWTERGGASLLGGNEIRRIIPVGKKVVDFSSKSHIMGILNVTPDSFSDGGKFTSVDTSLKQVREMVSLGADIIDVGGQSTRPGADAISCQEECDRVLPIIEAIKADEEYSQVLLSVDTFYSKVAEDAIRLGADIVNDVSAGRLDGDMYKIVAQAHVPFVMMHMRGNPKTMQSEACTSYSNLVEDMASELESRVAIALERGVMPWCVITDPGVGFAKNHDQNKKIMKSLSEFRGKFSTGFLRNAPMLVGPSRKGFLGSIVNKAAPQDRDVATSAAIVLASMQGCNIFRVHNVGIASDALKVADAVRAA